MSGHRVCRHCGKTVYMVEVVPSKPVNRELREIPLDVDFDPATSPIRASHALNARGTACHPITKDWPVSDSETPALTHFATCPARRPRTPDEGPPR